MKVTSLIIPNVKKFLTISLRLASALPERDRLKRYRHSQSHPGSARPTSPSTLTMAKFEPVTHVIFDMDGVLLDTEKIYHNVLGSIAKKYNKEFIWEVRMAVMGTSDKDCAKIMVEGLNLPITPEEFHNQKVEVQAGFLKDAELMPGADRLVRHLHNNGVPIAVATSTSLKSIDIKTAKHTAMFSLFHHIVSGSSDPEVKRGKPNPDIFLVCCSRFADKPNPAKCLVVEDAPNGVKAARAAGMQVVMIPDKATEEERRKEATLVLESLNDFKLELFGLPPLDSTYLDKTTVSS